MFVDYKFGKRTCDLPMSNEDWQFERPILSVGKDQKPQYKRTHPKVVKAKDIPINGIHITDFLKELEAKQVDFKTLQRDKQVKLVAEEYNKGTKISVIKKTFGLNNTKLYNLINEGKALGLIMQLRSETIDPVQDFNSYIFELKKRFDDVNRTYGELEEQLIVANKTKQIIDDICELLGDEADDIVGTLIERVVLT